MAPEGGGVPPWESAETRPHQSTCYTQPTPQATQRYHTHSATATRFPNTPRRIAPPPLYIQQSRPANQPPQRWKTAYEPTRTFRNRPELGSRNYCAVCERNFPSAEILELHEAEDHVLCDFEKCVWSGPPQILASHRLSHICNEQGEKITESPTEAALWLAARRRARLLKSIKTEDERAAILAEQPRLSLLELNLRGEKGPNAPARRIPHSVLIPTLSNSISLYENRRRDLSRPSPSVYKPGTKVQFHAQFPICHPLLYNRPCPNPEKCKRSHDIQAYRRWEFMKNKTGARVRNICHARQTLLHMLLADEIEDFEDTLVAACKSLCFLSSNRFKN